MKPSRLSQINSWLSENITYFVFSIIWIFFTCKSTINVIYNMTFAGARISSSVILYVIIIFILFIECRILLHNITKLDIAIMIISILAMCTCARSNTFFVTWATEFLAFDILFYIGGRNLKNNEKALNFLLPASIISLAFAIIFVIIATKQNSFFSEYEKNMSGAYYFLPSVMVLIHFAFEKKKIVYWILAVGGIVVMYMFGTRGPFLCVAAYIVFEILRRKKIRWLSLPIAGIIALIINKNFIDWIFKLIEQLYAKSARTSYILNMYKQGVLLSDTGRSTLHEDVLEMIKLKPFIGYGFLGEHTIVDYTPYCHSILYDLWCQFGYIFGTLVLVVLIAFIISAFVKADRNGRTLIAILVCSVMIKMIYSGTYSQEPNFYFLIAICVSQYCMRKSKAVNKDVEIKRVN